MQQHIHAKKKAGSLRTLLTQCRVPSGSDHTHRGWGETKQEYFQGNFNIPPSRQTELHSLLAKAVFQDNECVTLTECPGEAGPLRVDLDINYTIDPDNPPVQQRVYEGNFIDQFLGMLCAALDQYVAMPEEMFKRLLYVFEKGAPTSKTGANDVPIWKDGVHIMMPHIITTPHVQEVIREIVMLDMDGLLTDMREAGFQVTSRIDEIYDEAVIARNGWMMYGCSKSGGSPYQLTSIWNGAPGDGLHKYTESEIDGDVLPSNIRRSLDMLFRYRHCKYTGDDSYAVQFIRELSIHGYDSYNALPCSPEFDKYIKNSIASEKKKIDKQRKTDPGVRALDDKKDIQFAVDLVKKCLSDTRADDYQSWVKLCWCLHNIHNVGKNELKTAFIEFSKRSTRYTNEESETACETYWKQARSLLDTRDKLGMGSLCDWAKRDNPEEYKKLMTGRLEHLIGKCCNQYMPDIPPKKDEDGNLVRTQPKPCNWDDVNWHLVEVLFKQYGYNMVCTSVSIKIWWEYKNHRWTNITEGLRNYLSVDVHDLFDAVKDKHLLTLNALSNDSEERPKFERLMKAAAGIARHTRNSTSKSKIFNESCERFAWNYRSHTKDAKHDKAFEELLDLNLYLIGLENGVYDLKEHAFRPGCCDDMLSLGTGNPWHEPKLGWKDPTVIAIQRFLSQVLPDRQTCQYVMTLFASFLSGKVSELFHLFVGCGGNGKSKLIDLFTAAMGQTTGGSGYCGNLPTTALTGKRGCSSGPSPEFARLRGMRFVVVQEPETKDRLQPGRLKELTGGDTIQARALHKAPIEFKPQFGMVMASNVLPKVPGDDGGLWRRMRVVRFKSRFRREPIPDDPTEFPIDEELTDKLREWRFTFFWMLTRYYKAYVEGDTGIDPILDYAPDEPRADKGLPKCASVVYETNRYQSQNDPINKFIVDHVNKDLPPLAQKTAVVDFDILWTRYVGWCKQQHSLADQDDLRNAMEHRFDVMQEGGTGFRGWRKIALWTETEMQSRGAAGEDEGGGNTDSGVGSGGAAVGSATNSQSGYCPSP